MKTWHTIIGISVVAVGVTWWAQGRQRGETEQLRGSVQSLTRSLEDTNRAVARTAAARLRPAAADSSTVSPESPAAAAPESPEPGPPASSEGEPAHPPRIDAATLRAHLDSRFDGQAADAAWSGAARGMVEGKLAALMPQFSTLRSVECRSTMCRIEMVYDDLAQYQAFLQRVTPDALPWNGTLFAAPLSDPSEKPITFVAFLSREGQQLAVE